MILSSSALWPRACTGASTTSSARVAHQRRKPFLSDMSGSVEARSDLYGQLANRVDANRLRRSEPLAQYTTFRIGGPADLFYDATSADDLAGAVSAAREAGVGNFFFRPWGPP